MLVHFIGSKSDIQNDIKYFRQIVSVLKGHNYHLARDWVEEVYQEEIEGHTHKESDWQKINQINMEALAKADITVAEASAKSFSIGFQVAMAIQQKKPLLILTRNNSLEGTFGSGISSDFVQFANYSEETLPGIIERFIDENTFDSKDMRFNFFIDRKIYNYLRWASFKSGKTKAEILRELVNREIEQKDY